MKALREVYLWKSFIFQLFVGPRFEWERAINCVEGRTVV